MPRRFPRVSAPTEADRLRLALDLESLTAMNLAQMRTLWSTRLSRPHPPNLKSPEIFRGLLGSKLRAQVEGDMSATARKKLREIEAKSKAGEKIEFLPRLNIGVRLEREYKGVMHEVDVVEGGFSHQGTTYRSLSEVARAITNSRWSGPRFFGLKGNSQ
ncbi:MAG: DUF2924 domain-containing protein [Alphaproteobacteria bacterium]|nr:MAG: DUF2924 domain-containing protein [Alphaproteobacteria bacterium]